MIDASTYFAEQRIATAVHVLRQDVVPNVHGDARRRMDDELREIEAAVAELERPGEPEEMRAADAAYHEGRRDVAVLEAILDDAIAARLVIGDDIERATLAINNMRWWVSRP